MIEVEKKFEASVEQIKRVTEGAKLIQEIVNKDVYYDRLGFPLIKNNMTLRKRNGSFELKVWTAEEGSVIGKHREFVNENEIKKELGVPEAKDIDEFLKENEYVPFGSWETKRRKFEKDGFTIDIDSVDFGHDVIEIELMVEDAKDAAEAAQKIFYFANKQGLEIKEMQGKAMEFIQRTNPQAYDEIKAAWEKL